MSRALISLLLGAFWGLAAILLIAVAALIGVWWERKVAGRIQLRFGPQEAGPAGLLQTLTDTIKLVLKEDIVPSRADAALFKLMPYFVIVPTAASIVAVPFVAGWAPLNTSTSALFYLAVPGISVIGMLVAGWASGNTYATMGGLRAASQMISYEIPRTLSVLALCVLSGSLSTGVIREEWRPWWLLLCAVGLVVFLIASIAELNRGPFDLPEAESELVAGYFADYSGIRWAIFMMTEYGGIVASSLFASATFLGGGLGLPGLPGAILFVVFTALIATVIIWVKWTFPRLRPDQLMSFSWKVLTPLALLQLLVVGAVIPWL